MEHRIMVTCAILVVYPFGQVMAGWIGYIARDFRTLLRFAFVPGFLVSGLMYFATDSLRWLLIKGKQAQAERLVSKAAAVNNLTVSEEVRNIIQQKCDAARNVQPKNKGTAAPRSSDDSVYAVFKRKSLCSRFLIIAFCWAVGAYVNYGVSITSVSLHQNKYISFIIVSLGGVPSGLVTYFLMKYMGRPKCISLSFIITGIAIITAKLLPKEYAALSMILFFVSKCFSFHSANAVYVYTTELWPTKLRHSMMGLCSTVGRVGAMMAPLSPLLVRFRQNADTTVRITS